MITSRIEMDNPKHAKDCSSSISGVSIPPFEYVEEFCPYNEMINVHPFYHLLLPYKILLLNKFKFFKINNDFDLFYLVCYNYCILKIFI